MAGISGEPAPRPSQVQQPVPGASATSVFDSAEPGLAQSGGKAASAFDQGPDAAAVAPAQSDSGGAMQKFANALPVAGSIIGGIAGGTSAGLASLGVGAVPGAIGGAGVGAAGGEAWKQFIEQTVLGKTVKSPMDVLKDIGEEGLKGAAFQAVGEGMLRGAGMVGGVLADTAVGQAIGKYAAEPLAAMKNAVSSKVAELEAPVRQWIADRVLPMNAREAGDQAKNLLLQNIQAKYGKFVDAYDGLNQIQRTIQPSDAERLNFTTDLREWGAGANVKGSQPYQLVKKFADMVDSAQNGQQMESVVQEIGDAKGAAFKNGETARGKFLGELQDRVNDFMDSSTTKLAQRIAFGSASPQEMQFAQQLAQQRGLPPEEGTKYAKQLASDFLKQKDTVKAGYSGFRDFLDSVGEQTGVNLTKRGPRAFMQAVADVPSERLVEGMVDPKNSAALQRMKDQTPEVFDVVQKRFLTNLVEKSTNPDGTMDLAKLRGNLFKVPDATRKMLVTDSEYQALSKTVDDPRIANLRKMATSEDGRIISWAKKIAELTRSGIPAAANSPVLKPTVVQPVGNSLYNTFGPPQQPPAAAGQ